jgi:hypothetical protein
LFHRILARSDACQIARQAQTAPSFRFDGTRGFLGVAFLFGQIANGHIGAFTRVKNRHRASDTGITAGDERNFSFEFARRAIAPGFIARTRVEFGFESRRRLVLLREPRFRFRPHLCARAAASGFAFRLVAMAHQFVPSWLSLTRSSACIRGVRIRKRSAVRRAPAGLPSRSTRSNTRGWVRPCIDTAHACIWSTRVLWP